MHRQTKRMLVESLNRDAERIATRFGLHYKAIQAERANVTSRYGVCFSDGVIKIRLRHAVSGRPLKYSSMVNTLCHELAHLRHFNHGLRFRAFYQQLLNFARAEGIYRPTRPVTNREDAWPNPPRFEDPDEGRSTPSVPAQLSLFES